jgi:transposase InsO family protein
MVGKRAVVEKKVVAVEALTRGMSLAQASTDFGVSVASLKRWRSQFREGGIQALVNQSSRPTTSPGATDPVVVARIVELRRSLPIDRGAASIVDALEAEGHRVPNVRTVHRILVREGLVVPMPQRRPKASITRFQASAPNELWQIDATTHWLANGTGLVVFDVIDDYSRLCVASLVSGYAENGVDAAQALRSGIEVFGPPVRVLSDNGTAFFSKEFLDACDTYSIKTVNSRPYHPQTCGKVERFHQTMKTGMSRLESPKTIDGFVKRLNKLIDYYNHERRHRGINRQIPFEAWDAVPKLKPTSRPAPRRRGAETLRSECVVQPDGQISFGRMNTRIPRSFAGKTVTVLRHHDAATIWLNNHQIARIKIKPGQRTQRIA